MKALVVDDDLALADVVSFTLRRAGHEVIVANDGAMALERWKGVNGTRVSEWFRVMAETEVLASARDLVDGVRVRVERGA